MGYTVQYYTPLLRKHETNINSTNDRIEAIKSKKTTILPNVTGAPEEEKENEKKNKRLDNNI